MAEMTMGQRGGLAFVALIFLGLAIFGCILCKWARDLNDDIESAKNRGDTATQNEQQGKHDQRLGGGWAAGIIGTCCALILGGAAIYGK
jgi:hypothetical protein